MALPLFASFTAMLALTVLTSIVYTPASIIADAAVMAASAHVSYCYADSVVFVLLHCCAALACPLCPPVCLLTCSLADLPCPQPGDYGRLRTWASIAWTAFAPLAGWVNSSFGIRWAGKLRGKCCIAAQWLSQVAEQSSRCCAACLPGSLHPHVMLQGGHWLLRGGVHAGPARSLDAPRQRPEAQGRWPRLAMLCCDSTLLALRCSPPPRTAPCISACRLLPSLRGGCPRNWSRLQQPRAHPCQSCSSRCWPKRRRRRCRPPPQPSGRGSARRSPSSGLGWAGWKECG